MDSFEDENKEGGLSVSIMKIMSLMAMCMDLAFSPILALFGGFHVYMASRNTTSIEGRDCARQYDVGTMNNLRQVFGKNIYYWPLPIYGEGSVHVLLLHSVMVASSYIYFWFFDTSSGPYGCDGFDWPNRDRPPPIPDSSRGGVESTQETALFHGESEESSLLSQIELGEASSNFAGYSDNGDEA